MSELIEVRRNGRVIKNVSKVPSNAVWDVLDDSSMMGCGREVTFGTSTKGAKWEVRLEWTGEEERSLMYANCLEELEQCIREKVVFEDAPGAVKE